MTAPEPGAMGARERGGAERALRDALVYALQQAWDDFVDDTGCYPDCIQRESRGRIAANFDVSNFALFAAGWLESKVPGVAAFAERSLSLAPPAAPPAPVVSGAMVDAARYRVLRAIALGQDCDRWTRLYFELDAAIPSAEANFDQVVDALARPAGGEGGERLSAVRCSDCGRDLWPIAWAACPACGADASEIEAHAALARPAGGTDGDISQDENIARPAGGEDGVEPRRYRPLPRSVREALAHLYETRRSDSWAWHAVRDWFGLDGLDGLAQSSEVAP